MSQSEQAQDGKDLKPEQLCTCKECVWQSGEPGMWVRCALCGLIVSMLGSPVKRQALAPRQPNLF